jgi:glycosyltransferase involved in cell wall biosynthesis
MKLMSIITTLNPAHGGPVECATQLHKNMIAMGHSYDVVTLDSPDADWNARLPFTPIALGKKGHDHRMFEPELVRFLKRRQSEYDGTILHGIWTVPTVAMRIAWDGTHRYVVFPHGMLDPYFINNFPLKHVKKSLFYRLIAAPVLSNALATLFTCEEERRLANTSYKPVVGTRRVVRYGINPPVMDLSAYQGRLAELKQKLAGKDVLLYLGRIHPKKGCDLLIDAMARLAARYPAAHLIMAGPDQTGLGAKLEKLTLQKGLADRITWVGPVYGMERWFLYNLADVFILPSHMENFGMTVAESLSQRCPVLISDKVNIYGSILEHSAGFVDSDTLEGTVALIDRWCSLHAGERQAMCERAYQLFDRQFRASYTADDVVAVFQEDRKQRHLAA